MEAHDPAIIQQRGVDVERREKVAETKGPRRIVGNEQRAAVAVNAKQGARVKGNHPKVLPIADGGFEFPLGGFPQGLVILDGSFGSKLFAYI